MSRGDQRERDRAKRQAKLAKEGKNNQREGTPLQRNADDKAALAAKVAAKKAKKEAEEAAAAGAKSGSGPVKPKKAGKKKDDGLDLLDAGLAVKKKGKKK
mmetsp:Transcript_49270/g.73481  ORF Transcript_49270/g.73481 Transcript_49270/m.73481 type:complete len:100 (-) Transcript_49270:842-1141(-)